MSSETTQQLLQSYESTFTGLTKYQYHLFNNYLHTAPWISVVGYLLMVFLLPKIMIAIRGGRSSTSSPPPSSSQPQKFGLLKYTMASWNLFLSVLSLVMMVGFGAPFLKIVLGDRGVGGTICDVKHDLFVPSSMMFWANIFVFSKYIELLDTVFLIVKNPERPVPFLHFYHHATVLAFSWYAAHMKYSAALWSILINSSVHLVMYFYYFLTELGYRPSWAVVITVTQITQMVVGVAMNGIWVYKYMTGAGCQCDAPNAIMISALIMYGSYLLLFVQFFVKRYSKKPSAGTPKSKQL